MTAALREHRGKRVLLHHNITPPEFFAGWDDELRRICIVGREELSSLRGQVDLGLADSEFNRRELEALGFARTGVLPIYLDFRRYRESPNPVVRRLLEDGRTNLLFVGRVVPNKRHDDLIRLASYWKRFISPDLRLVLVGKRPRRHEYMDALQSLFFEEGFTPAEVVFTGHVEHDELLACYAAADVFVSMSEHEGFGVPLVEAMLMRVPVVAYRSTAVGDTLGEAGLQFTEKRLAEMAEAAHLVTTDASLRERILAGQDRRLAAFAPAAVEQALRGYVDAIRRGDQG
jgi:glycosyltransferase involved in cell wall biosynthesis